MLSCLLLQLEGLNFEFSEQRAPMMLASIWPSRDENHGQNGHNLALPLCRLLWVSEKALRDKSAKKRPKIWSIDIKGIILHTEIWFS